MTTYLFLYFGLGIPILLLAYWFGTKKAKERKRKFELEGGFDIESFLDDYEDSLYKSENPFMHRVIRIFANLTLFLVVPPVWPIAVIWILWILWKNRQ